jgi:hypothetical protein
VNQSKKGRIIKQTLSILSIQHSNNFRNRDSLFFSSGFFDFCLLLHCDLLEHMLFEDFNCPKTRFRANFSTGT